MLINLRNALMAGKRLPYDAEVEFLESTGTQWIDTGIVWESVTTAKTEATVQYTQTSGRQIICGASTAFYFGCNANRWEYVYRLYTGTVGTDVTTVAKEVTSEGMKFYINGSLAATVTQSASQEWWGSSAYVFGLNNGGSFILPSTARLYSLKIWIGDSLVFDGIPVRKGSVGYLYDRVSGELFGNAGTGDFALGPDVVPVEYLQSSGTQYIDTGVVGYKTTKVESHCALLNANSAYPAMWGARTGSRNNDFQIYYNTPTIGGNPSSIVLRTGNSDKSISTSDIGVNTFIGTRLDIVAADRALSVNGYNFSTPAFSNFTTPHSILMFCEYTANSLGNFGSFVYWGMKMWQADSIVRSFLPVRVGTDATSWEGAMMDVLTRRIYRNAGSGAFAYGNDLKYPIPAE